MKKFPKKLGAAFPEGLEASKKRKGRPGAEELVVAKDWLGKDFFGRKAHAEADFRLSAAFLAPIYFLFAACPIILLARAFDLQVIQGKLFLEKAEGNQIRLQVSHAPRGVIFDRDGKILAQNGPGFRLLVDSSKLPKEKKGQVVARLSSILGIPAAAIEENLKKASSGDEITITNDLAEDKARIIEADESDLPGVVLEVSPLRVYPYKEVTAHILGYTAEADADDLARKSAVPYSLGDKVGKAGAEAAFEKTLRGKNGYRLVKVTAAGAKKGEIYQSEPVPGQAVTLSIDVELQKFVYEALEKKLREVGAKAGSAVVLDSSTGEILALVSLPSYDDNLFSKGLTTQTYQALVSSPDKLLLNRAVGASYPPGSTFKMVTATAGLETKTITKETKIVDTGFITLGSRVFVNWLWHDQHKTEGSINVVRAIARSTDTFFYQLGQSVGEEQIAKYAFDLGLGKETGIELPGEVSGLVPTPEWKLKTKGESWYPGETLNLSIGQGDLLVTPLQLTMVTAAFANGGKRLIPTILKTDTPKLVSEKFLKKETIEVVREGLYQDTVGDGNVGWLFGGFKISSAGKTGSAESGQEQPHAWYTAYAPHPSAKIVVTVQAEYAGHGSEVCAPVVKQIFEWYFRTK